MIKGISGSGPFGAVAQIAWFGHPAQESALPACWDSGPGQCSGSGATRLGFCFSGLARTSATESGPASREGAMVGDVRVMCGWWFGLVWFVATVWS